MSATIQTVQTGAEGTLEPAGSQTETQPVTTSNTAKTKPTREISLNWLLSLASIGTTLIAAMLTILMLLIISLGDRIDANTTRIENLGTELRTEMQAGFAEIHTILRDHTDRLARLETAAGLPRPEN